MYIYPVNRSVTHPSGAARNSTSRNSSARSDALPQPLHLFGQILELAFPLVALTGHAGHLIPEGAESCI